MASIPQDFNWVEARAECSVAKIFSTLFQDATEDVSEANELKMERFPRYPVKFGIRSNSSGNVFVVYEEGNTETEVKFSLASDRIVIASSGNKYVVTPTLNDEGKCKLRIDGAAEAFEQWQVRRRILEDLFFGSGLSMPSTPQTSEDRL